MNTTPLKSVSIPDGADKDEDRSKDNANVWDEIPLGSEGKVKGAASASLNELIALLASDMHYDIQ
jgi:hypothetical protein